MPLPTDAADSHCCLSFEKPRTLNHQTTWKRLLVRTTTQAEHQNGQIALDPDRVQHVPSLFAPPFHKKDVTLGMALGHLPALLRQPHCPASRATRQRADRRRAS